MAWSGTTKLRNPEKYVGDVNKVFYRSRIEMLYHKWLDTHPEVEFWNAEETVVPYISPIDLRPHRYFPDLLIKFKNGQTVMVELKHSTDLKEPIPPKKRTPRYINECKTWEVNQAKWRAAEIYCEERGWKFKVMSERELGSIYNQTSYKRPKKT